MTYLKLLPTVMLLSGASTAGCSSSGDDTKGAVDGGQLGAGGAGGAGGGGGSGAVGSDAGDICRLPMEVGPCDAAILRYWFNAQTGKCEPFSYGGCGGNANKFETPKACTDTCAPSTADACQVVVCEPGTRCVYVQASVTCAMSCDDAGACPTGSSCGCGASCPNCKDCVQACV